VPRAYRTLVSSRFVTVLRRYPGLALGRAISRRGISDVPSDPDDLDKYATGAYIVVVVRVFPTDGMLALPKLIARPLIIQPRLDRGSSSRMKRLSSSPPQFEIPRLAWPSERSRKPSALRMSRVSERATRSFVADRCLFEACVSKIPRYPKRETRGVSRK